VVIASELRDGMVVRIEGQVFKVLEVEVKAGGGQLGGVGQDQASQREQRPVVGTPFPT
jgi:hypothetical protein